MDWRPYVLSIAVGLLVGGLYGLLGTRSPAPPVIALLGLLGMLLGEMAVGWARSRLSADDAAAACLHAKSFAVAAKPDHTPSPEPRA